MLRKIILPVLLLFALSGKAQDINGIWKGKLIMEPGGCFPVYNIELQLQVAGTRITGTSYHYSDTSNYVKETFEGIYKKDSNNISIGEIGVTVFHIPGDCIPCIKKYNLAFHKGGTEEQLRGAWSGKTMDNKSTCPPGTIVLTRFDKSSFKPELRLPPQLTKRKAELVKEIYVDTGAIKIDFYDNGQIDGDTISVFANNMPVVSNKRLGTRPVSITIKIDLKRTEQEVIMVGENLGAIPPNTALMIITAADKRYQLYLTSDEQKNAMVRFIYQKPK
ncbi:MAG TPA: hypothetical protein VK483_10900 [Chitinophagaceae bacterium]|nr:hypothetical protein [Chitinophagaceae bacterium]